MGLDLSEDKDAPVMVTRVRLFNVEQFARERHRQMVGAVVLTVLFLCVLVAAGLVLGVW